VVRSGPAQATINHVRSVHAHEVQARDGRIARIPIILTSEGESSCLAVLEDSRLSEPKNPKLYDLVVEKAHF
jgi:hypothetical protein